MQHHATQRISGPEDAAIGLSDDQGPDPSRSAADGLPHLAPRGRRGVVAWAGRSLLMPTRFWRFCLVGGVGFVIDTSILLALVYGVGLGPVPAKILSFGVAIGVTFQLNRIWAFGATRHGSLGRSFATYLWVQGTGAACNLGMFSLLATRLPKPFDSLLLCAALAAAAALLVNYIGASRFVFAATRAVRPGPP